MYTFEFIPTFRNSLMEFTLQQNLKRNENSRLYNSRSDENFADAQTNRHLEISLKPGLHDMVVIRVQ